MKTLRDNSTLTGEYLSLPPDPMPGLPRIAGGRIGKKLPPIQGCASNDNKAQGVHEASRAKISVTVAMLLGGNQYRRSS